MGQLATAGIPAGIMSAPITPRINLPIMGKTVGDTVIRLNDAIEEIFTNWLQRNFPDRFDKVVNQIKELHGGNLNDSRYGRRIAGEGNIALIIKKLFKVAKKKYMSDKYLP